MIFVALFFVVTIIDDVVVVLVLNWLPFCCFNSRVEHRHQSDADDDDDADDGDDIKTPCKFSIDLNYSYHILENPRQNKITARHNEMTLQILNNYCSLWNSIRRILNVNGPTNRTNNDNCLSTYRQFKYGNFRVVVGTWTCLGFTVWVTEESDIHSIVTIKINIIIISVRRR